MRRQDGWNNESPIIKTERELENTVSVTFCSWEERIFLLTWYWKINTTRKGSTHLPIIVANLSIFPSLAIKVSKGPITAFVWNIIPGDNYVMWNSDFFSPSALKNSRGGLTIVQVNIQYSRLWSTAISHHSTYQLDDVSNALPVC